VASTRAGPVQLYRSLLGPVFSFDRCRPLGEQKNPYSRRGERQHNNLNKDGSGSMRIVYEEAYVNVNGPSMDLNGAARWQGLLSVKEYIVERMKDKRRDRVRERGDPNPYWRRNDGGAGDYKGSQSMGSIVM
jgi:hypothetical protein